MPKPLLSGNGTLSVNVHVQEMLNGYELDHMKLSLYYPQWNGHVGGAQQNDPWRA